MQFVCDYCQAEVGIKDKYCPICNTPFSKVRCPRCKYDGEAREFKNGCPRCGYTSIVLGREKNFSGFMSGLWMGIVSPKSPFDYRIKVFIGLLLLINVVLFLYEGFR